MIELIMTLASVGVGATGTYAWIEKQHGIATMLFFVAFGVGILSIKSLCGG